MNTYRFTLILADREDSEGDAEELYSQFDDGTLITSGGVTRIKFDREASSLPDAVESAITDVERTRFRVSHVETEESHIIDEINADLMTGASGQI